MEWLAGIIDLFLHLDSHLEQVIRQYDTWTYAILFAIIFCETGLVVTPFLPGDSLLFAAGIFANPKWGPLNVWLLSFLLITAAIIGDTVNYHIGKLFGSNLFKNENSKLFKRSHLDRTHAFFEKHGGKTIVIARFVPIVRTFAPFVAGMGAMTYSKFLFFNVTGAILWVAICVGAGYFFGGLQLVRDNFSIAILVIIAISVMPMVIDLLRHRAEKKRVRSQAIPEEA